MPNHITNIIEFECTDEQFEAIKARLCNDPGDDPYSSLDFNRIVPMPESLNIEAGSVGENAFRHYKKYMELKSNGHPKLAAKLYDVFVNKPDQYGHEHTVEEWELGKAYYDNLMLYGCATWYDWCIENWGTKWNAYDRNVNDEAHYFEFCTAWSGVPKLVQKISEIFPGIRIEYKFADEDIGNNVGWFVFQGGEMEEDYSPWGGTVAAYEFAADVMGVDLADYGLYLSEDGSTYEYREDEE